MKNKNSKTKIALMLIVAALLFGLIFVDGYSNYYSDVQPRTTNVQENENQVNNSDKTYFKNALETNENLNDGLVRKFAERKKANVENTQSIIKMAKLVRQEKRAKISEELLNLRNGFIKRISGFSDKDLRNRENVRKQIENYNNVLETKKEIKLALNDDKISEFLKNKNRNSDGFIVSIIR